MLNYLRLFGKSRSGNYGLMFALLLPVLLAAIGLAIDYGLMSKARGKLQNAVDAAVLAASRISDKTISRQTVFATFMDVNMVGEHNLTNIVAHLQVEEGLNFIRTTGTATADFVLPFSFIFGGKHSLTTTASAFESARSIEIAMVLDNTGSMGSAGMTQLRLAANDLVDILKDVHAPNATPRRDVRIGLVPYVTAVNIKGEGFKQSWIDDFMDPLDPTKRNPTSKYHGVHFDPLPKGNRVHHLDLFDKLGVQWKGCVEARPAPYDMSEDAPEPGKPDTLFVPYFAPDEPDLNSNYRTKNQPVNSDNQYYNNDYLNDIVTTKNSTAADHRLRQQSTVKYTAANAKVGDIRDGHISITKGPNRSCPTPIVPLTSDFPKLKTEIGKMIHWDGSGTNSAEGLAWGQRILTPGEPFAGAAAFTEQNMVKYLIIFTDGENQPWGAPNATINKSDYNSYGYVDEGRVTSNRSQWAAGVNKLALGVCKNLKAKNVEIFSIIYGSGITPANRDLYTSCATTPENYYAIKDATQLKNVFSKIAHKITGLYISN